MVHPGRRQDRDRPQPPPAPRGIRRRMSGRRPSTREWPIHSPERATRDHYWRARIPPKNTTGFFVGADAKILDVAWYELTRFGYQRLFLTATESVSVPQPQSPDFSAYPQRVFLPNPPRRPTALSGLGAGRTHLCCDAYRPARRCPARRLPRRSPATAEVVQRVAPVQRHHVLGLNQRALAAVGQRDQVRRRCRGRRWWPTPRSALRCASAANIVVSSGNSRGADSRQPPTAAGGAPAGDDIPPFHQSVTVARAAGIRSLPPHVCDAGRSQHQRRFVLCCGRRSRLRLCPPGNAEFILAEDLGVGQRRGAGLKRSSNTLPVNAGTTVERTRSPFGHRVPSAVSARAGKAVGPQR